MDRQEEKESITRASNNVDIIFLETRARLLRSRSSYYRRVLCRVEEGMTRVLWTRSSAQRRLRQQYQLYLQLYLYRKGIQTGGVVQREEVGAGVRPRREP